MKKKPWGHGPNWANPPGRPTGPPGPTYRPAHSLSLFPHPVRPTPPPTPLPRKYLPLPLPPIGSGSRGGGRPTPPRARSSPRRTSLTGLLPHRRQTPPPCLVPAAPSSTPRSTRSGRRAAPSAATRCCPRTSSPGAAPPSLPRLHLDGSNEPRRPLCSPTLVRAVPSSSLCPVRHGLVRATDVVPAHSGRSSHSHARDRDGALPAPAHGPLAPLP